MSIEHEMVTPPSVGVESDQANLEVYDADQRLLNELLGDPYDEKSESETFSPMDSGGVIVENGISVPGSEMEVHPNEGEAVSPETVETEIIELSAENHIELPQYERLEELIASVESDGFISRTIAEEMNGLMNGFLFKTVHPNGFTQLPSKSNLTASLESANIFKYGAMALGAAAIGYIAYRMLVRDAERAKAASTRIDIETISTKESLRSKDLSDYEKRIKRLTGHVSNGVVRNKRLLDNLQENATRRINTISTDVGTNPYKFGQELVEGIFKYKVEKTWSRGLMLTVQNSVLSNQVESLTNAYIVASQDLHKTFRKLKENVKKPERLNLADYQIDWSAFATINQSMEGTYQGSANGGPREEAIACFTKLENLFTPEAGLEVRKLSECLNIHANISVMNALDQNVYNTCLKIQTLYTDIHRYVKDSMKDENYANRMEILDDLDRSVRTLSNVYQSLLVYRGKVAGLVKSIRSAIKETNGMWDNLDRDQTGKL